MVRAGAIVEVDLAGKTDEHALIVSERACPGRGVPTEDGFAAVGNRGTAPVVDKAPLASGRVIEEFCGPARCPACLAGAEIGESCASGAGCGAELGQTAGATTHFGAGIVERSLLARRGAVGEKDGERSRRGRE